MDLEDRPVAGTVRDRPAGARPRSAAAFAEAARAALVAAGVSAGAHVLAAVSGGADSTALLLALDRLSRRLQLTVSVCYVDHSLRPAAEIEAERVRLAELCARLHVQLLVERVDVAAERARSRRAWEDAARRCRYRALGQAAARIDADVVATGHTADDQAETVLLRLLRGTGPLGLRGIRAVSRPWGAGGALLVRPLLEVRRRDTEAYCRAHGCTWSSDSSNISRRFLRNRVRLDLVPLIEEIRPGAGGALQRLARQADELGDWVEQETARLLAELLESGGASVLLRRPPFALHPYLAGAVMAAFLRRAMSLEASRPQRIVAAAVELWQGRSGRQLSLGYGWVGLSSDEGLLLRRSEGDAQGARPATQIACDAGCNRSMGVIL